MDKFGEDEWVTLTNNIVERFEPGVLISHEYLKKIFYLIEPKIEDFKDQYEFIETIKLIQFEYMTLVDKLRVDILETHKLYLRNIRGEGYQFLLPKEQTDFAKKQTMDSINKEMKRGELILRNVKYSSLSADDRRKNTDELAKIGQLSQMIKTVK